MRGSPLVQVNPKQRRIVVAKSPLLPLGGHPRSEIHRHALLGDEGAKHVYRWPPDPFRLAEEPAGKCIGHEREGVPREPFPGMPNNYRLSFLGRSQAPEED